MPDDTLPIKFQPLDDELKVIADVVVSNCRATHLLMGVEIMTQTIEAMKMMQFSKKEVMLTVMASLGGMMRSGLY